MVITEILSDFCDQPLTFLPDFQWLGLKFRFTAPNRVHRWCISLFILELLIERYSVPAIILSTGNTTVHKTDKNCCPWDCEWLSGRAVQLSSVSKEGGGTRWREAWWRARSHKALYIMVGSLNVILSGIESYWPDLSMKVTWPGIHFKSVTLAAVWKS